MKSKIVGIFFLILTVVFSLASCNFDLFGNTGGEKPPEGEPDDLIYNATSELFIITGDGVSRADVEAFVGGIYEHRENSIEFDVSSSEVHAHEIVIGNTDREISKNAYSRLDRVQKNSEEDLAYLIYSDGSSVAIVWDESENDEDGVMKKLAISYFADNYVTDVLTMKSGVAYSFSLNLIDDYYRAIDEEYRTAAWKNFENSYGKELADSFKQLYAIYSADCIVWLANLYDPSICVCRDLYGEKECSGTKYCGTGGFYYSKSARDTMGYLPDAESTTQAIEFLNASGLTYRRGDAYYDVLTEDMRKKIGDFVYALEEPNGYFYHPQWSIELVDSLPSRRARDLSWCVGILQRLGRTPKYTTASGVPGEDATPASCNLTARLGCSRTASAVIAVVADSYNPNLQDLDAFKAYLAKQDIKNNSYPIGNTLSAMTGEIQARDRQIGTAQDPTPLMDYLIDWLNANQNPETGHWDYKKPGEVGYGAYNGVNGLLKIINVYNAHKAPLPYAEEAAKSAMEAISSDTPINAVVDLYNTWYALQLIIKNLRNYAPVSQSALADEIVSSLRADAPETILISRDKIKDFIKPDGSASYYKDYSAPVSQGAPVAIPNSYEGDVNGSTIAINGIITNAALALGVTRIPTFGEAERAIFRDIVKNIESVTKKAESAPEPIDFESNSPGETPDGVTVNIGTAGGSATVARDPENGERGNVLHLVSNNGAADSVVISVGNSSINAGVYVFEGDFLVESANGNYLIQLMMDSAYMLTFKMVEGELQIWESSSATGANAVEEYLGVAPNMGEWFSLRCEYYYGDHDTVRIKVYVGNGEDQMKLCAVSDNYYDGGGTKVYKGTGTPSAAFSKVTVFAMSAAELDMYLDNLNAYKARIKYEKPDDEDSLYLNVDPKDSDRVLYGFEGNCIPEDVVISGGAVASEEAIYLDGGSGSEINFPINVRTSGAKCAVISMDVKLSSYEVGAKLVMRALDGDKKMFDHILTVEDDGGEKYISITPKGQVLGTAIDGVRISPENSFVITFEYYHDGDIVLIYVDEVFAGATSVFYADGIKGKVDSFSVIAEAGGASAIIDDVFAEMVYGRLEDAVSPKNPSVKHDFNTEDKDVKLNGSGASFTTYGGDGVVKLDSEKSEVSLNIRANVRSAVVNEARLGLNLNYLSGQNGKIAHYLDIKNSADETIVRFAIKITESAAELYEVGKGGVLQTPLYIYSDKSNIDLSIEVFSEKNTVYIVSGGKRVAKSSVFYGREIIDSGISHFYLSSGDGESVLLADDLVFETLFGIYVNENISGGVNKETDLGLGIGFENSNSGNIPSVIKQDLISTDAFVGVSNLYNGASEEYSNALVFSTVSGTNDRISVVKGTFGEGQTASAFEADMMLDLKGDGYSYQIFFTDTSYTKHVYLIQLEVREGKVIITDNSNSNNNAGINNVIFSGIPLGEWFNLRVEYYRAEDPSDIRIKLYVNGVLAKVSNNYYGKENAGASPNSVFNNVSFYSFSATSGSIYLDNVILYDYMGSCDEEAVE